MNAIWAALAASLPGLLAALIAWLHANSAHQRITDGQRPAAVHQPPVAQVLADLGYQYLMQLADSGKLPAPAVPPIPAPVTSPGLPGSP